VLVLVVGISCTRIAAITTVFQVALCAARICHLLLTKKLYSTAFALLLAQRYARLSISQPPPSRRTSQATAAIDPRIDCRHPPPSRRTSDSLLRAVVQATASSEPSYKRQPPLSCRQSTMAVKAQPLTASSELPSKHNGRQSAAIDSLL
jgi:hypothetical protein